MWFLTFPQDARRLTCELCSFLFSTAKVPLNFPDSRPAENNFQKTHILSHCYSIQLVSEADSRDCYF